MFTRREFMATTATVIPGAVAGTQQKETVPVIDTHLHCFAGKDDARFPYHKDAPYKPNDKATPEHLLKCMTDAGVDFAVVVHPEPYQDDHTYLEHCLAVGKGKLKGTCLLFADRPDTPAKLKELAKKLPLVAARIHAYQPDRLPPFGKPELKAIWKAAADSQLAIQLHFEPRYAEGFEPYIKEFKDTRVFVDHLGRPFQGTEKEYAVVMRWAKLDNVVVKLSAVPSKNSYPHRDPQTAVKRLTEAFGADRLMYGGGFGLNATGKSYREERERIASLLAYLSATDRAKVIGGTAAKLMGFGDKS